MLLDDSIPIASPSLDGLHALVVDDCEDSRRLLAHLLERDGMSVEFACNGQEAIDRILDEAAAMGFDVLLIDLQMPVLDGLSTIRELRRLGRHEPILAITSDCDDTAEFRSVEAGANGFASKPLRRPALVRGILQVVSVGFTCRSQE